MHSNALKIKYYYLLPILLVLQCASSEMFSREDIDYSKYKRIAVLPLSDYPNKPGFGIQFADMLSIQLMKSNYNIIDRSQTAHVLQEQSLGLSGVVDENTAPGIGKLLGVQALLTGSVSEYQCRTANIQLIQEAAPAYMSFSRAGLALKLIDAETGQVVWAGTAWAQVMGANIEAEAAKKAIKSILKKLNSLNINHNPDPPNTDRIVRTDDIQKTLLPHFRRVFPKYTKFNDEQIVNAFRNTYPQHKDKSDIWIINYLESKYKNN